VILAGGLGTRLAEETDERPKALVEIGGRPILWHIMSYYAHFGLTDFIVALGYLGDKIVQYVDEHRGGQVPSHWKIDLINTGQGTNTGGRVKRLEGTIAESPFLLTWCDGLSDINPASLISLHESHPGLTTLVAVHPPSRFGEVELEGDRVTRFREKPERPDEWINGGIFIVDRKVCDYIEDDDTDWDRAVLPRLAEDGLLYAYRHTSFWQCMDTLKERRALEAIWQSGTAPWKVWE
jgi:glucose-1-phosphate cytidylyltransferase